MAKPLLVRNARQLLTLQGPSRPRRGAELNDVGMVTDGAVLIVDGIIREVGPTRRLENLSAARDAVEIYATGRVVLPGFVDSHTHLVGPIHGIDDARGEEGLPNYDRPLEGGIQRIGPLSSRVLTSNAIQVLKSCVRHGTTTLEAKSGYGGDEPGEMKVLKTQVALKDGPCSLVSTFMGSRFAPSPEQARRDDYLSWLCDHMLPLISRRRLAEFVDIQCDEKAYSVEQANRFLTRARQLGFGLKMHAGQFSNIDAVRIGVELGATSIDHLIHLEERDFELLANSSVIATLLPGAVFYLGQQAYPRARAMIDRGVAVALATNFNWETSPSPSMQTMIGLACRHMQMTAAEAISAATINAAHALRRADHVGSLQVGKDANLLILSVRDYREIAQRFGVNLVETTIKEGRVVYREPEIAWDVA